MENIKVYITLDNEGYADGWAESRGSDTDIEVELPEEHDFYMNMRSYKLENGVLVKDIHREAALRAEREKYKNTPTTKEEIEALKEENRQLSDMVNMLTSAFLMTANKSNNM